MDPTSVCLDGGSSRTVFGLGDGVIFPQAGHALFVDDCMGNVVAHGVRNTAAGLRYVIYAFATDLKDPAKVIAEPSGLLIGPRGDERVGDVSNVVFTNGAIANEKGEVFIYYASSDTRMHVATTTIDKLVDYVFHTPSDPGRSVECVAQRCELIRRNEEFLKQEAR